MHTAGLCPTTAKHCVGTRGSGGSKLWVTGPRPLTRLLVPPAARLQEVCWPQLLDPSCWKPTSPPPPQQLLPDKCVLPTMAGQGPRACQGARTGIQNGRPGPDVHSGRGFLGLEQSRDGLRGEDAHRLADLRTTEAKGRVRHGAHVQPLGDGQAPEDRRLLVHSTHTSTIILTVGRVVERFWGCGGRTVTGTQPQYRQP